LILDSGDLVFTTHNGLQKRFTLNSLNSHGYWEEIHFLDCSGQMLLMICSTLAVMKFE
jgi:hypothetical protein